MTDHLQLLGIPTAPRHEDLVANFIMQWLKRRSIPFRCDARGNILAKLKAKSSRSSVAFAAHMDHPGFEISRVKDKFIECEFLGGVARSYFQKGVSVEFFDVHGKVAGNAKIQGVLSWESRVRIILLKQISGNLRQGMFGMWKLPVLQFTSTHIVNRVCDDLAGCAAILSTLSAVQKKRSHHAVYAIFTRREEIGLEGAFEIARSKLLPKAVPIISIETSKELSNARQGDGPIVRVGDRTSIFDPGASRLSR